MIMMIRSVAGLLIIDVTISSLDINQCDGPRHREGDYLRQSRLWWWWWWLFQLPSNHGCDRITIKVIIVIMVMIMVVVTNQCSCVLPNSQLFSKFCRELYHIQKYLKAQRIGQTTNMHYAMYLWINCFKFMIHENNMANWLKTVLLIRVISRSEEYFLCFQLLWSSSDLPMRMSIWLWKGHHIWLKFFYQQVMMLLATSEPFIQRTSATIRARCFFYISMTITFLKLSN